MLTKIIATIGPSSHNYDTFKKMAEAGMNIMRANMSHCTSDEYKERLEFINKARQEGYDIKLLADLQGPRIRVKNVPEDGKTVKIGDRITFVTNGASPQDNEIGVDDPYLHTDLKIGDTVLVANGAIESVVTSTNPDNHRFEVEFLNEGVIYPNKGLNMPMTKLTTSCLTEKDRHDINFINQVGADFVALSFVQSADDLRELKKLITNPKVKIVVKIERQEALNNLDEIIKEADAVMVARGDLGVEIPMAELPIIQKKIIRQCHLNLKPAIVATQMLSNMVKEPSPTRAEVSDIANAVIDGAHAIMLSDETANGRYPIESVRTMAKVVLATEKYLQY